MTLGWISVAIQRGFPRGRIIPSDDVIERHGFLKKLEDHLYYGDSIMLASPRRTGKSSVAFEVMRRLSARGCYTLDMDLLHIVNIERFALQALEKVTQLRTGKLESMSRSLHDFLRWIAKPDLSIKMQDVEFGLRFHGDPKEMDPWDVLQEAFEMAERIAVKDDRRLVFLLDEFQEIDQLGGERLLRLLRSVFQRQENTTYLFSGSEPSMMKTIFADHRQAFYRFAAIWSLPEITPDEWQAYIAKKFTQFGMSVEDRAIELLIRATGGHPYCMMTALSIAFVDAKDSAMALTRPIAEESLHQAFDQLDAVYENLWRRVSEISLGEEVLAALVEGNPPYRGNNPTAVQRAIDALIKTSIIIRASRGQYRFVEPMFQRWIKYKIGRQLDLLDEFWI